MIPETSAAVVAVRAPATGFARLPSPRAADDGAMAVARAGLPRGVRRLVSGLGDVLGLVAVAYAFPLVILAVGIPIALLVRLAIWLVRAL